MKKLNKFFILIIILAFQSCGITKMQTSYKTVKYKVSPSVLETHGKQVKVKIDGEFPPKYFAKKALMTITPVITSELGQKELNPIRLQGEEFTGGKESWQKGDKTIFYEAGGKFKYEDQIAYDENLNISKLVLKASIESQNSLMKEEGRKIYNLDPITIAEGIITTSERVHDNEEVANTNHGYEHVTILEEKATIYFLVNQSNIRTTEKSDSDIKSLKEFISNGYKTHSIEIISYASPEGSINTNDNVSKDRMRTTVNYTKRLLKKLKVDGAMNDDLYTETSVGEDWDGFESILKKSQIKDKRKINNIIKSVQDVELREQQIRDLSEIYDAVKNDVLPQLRKATIIIRSFEPKKNDEEIKLLSTSDPEKLTLNELLFSATLTNKLDEKKNIYNSVINLHNDWRGYNNLACLYIIENKLEEAKKQLDIAASITNNKLQSDILTNKGIIESRKGNLKIAQKLYNQANTSELNQAILDIRKGEYNKAARFYKNKTNFNATLSKILNGNNNSLCNEKNAECYYLNAIALNRKGDLKASINYLNLAIERDSKYRLEAKNDLEFLNIRSNEDFIKIIK